MLCKQKKCCNFVPILDYKTCLIIKVKNEMKKVFLFFAVAIAIASCAPKSAEEGAATDSVAVDTIAVVDTVVVDTVAADSAL